MYHEQTEAPIRTVAFTLYHKYFVIHITVQVGRMISHCTSKKHAVFATHFYFFIRDRVYACKLNGAKEPSILEKYTSNHALDLFLTKEKNHKKQSGSHFIDAYNVILLFSSTNLINLQITTYS